MHALACRCPQSFLCDSNIFRCIINFALKIESELDSLHDHAIQYYTAILEAIAIIMFVTIVS